MTDVPRLALLRFGQWLLNEAPQQDIHDAKDAARLDWVRVVPFIALHLGCLAAFFTGVSATALYVAGALYVARMFFITAFYHRYFSHRAFRVSRPVQFLMAVAGCSCGQRGPVWWAAHHRHHHMASDKAGDPHSPRVQGFWFSHTLWFLTRGTIHYPESRVRDWLRFPELRWLERLDWVPFVALGAACYGFGAWLESAYPALGTSGAQMLVVGFLWSTVAVYHATYSTNSVAHRFGSRRFKTADDSRNNAFVAVLTLGEGWHNNHHHCPATARQGFVWWEFDPAWLGLRLMAAVGLVRDLKPVPPRVLAELRGEEATV